MNFYLNFELGMAMASKGVRVKIKKINKKRYAINSNFYVYARFKIRMSFSDISRSENIFVFGEGRKCVCMDVWQSRIEIRVYRWLIYTSLYLIYLFVYFWLSATVSQGFDSSNLQLYTHTGIYRFDVSPKRYSSYFYFLCHSMKTFFCVYTEIECDYRAY